MLYRNILVLVAIFACLGMSACGAEVIPQGNNEFLVVEGDGGWSENYDADDILRACGNEPDNIESVCDLGAKEYKKLGIDVSSAALVKCKEQK